MNITTSGSTITEAIITIIPIADITITTKSVFTTTTTTTTRRRRRKD